MIHPIERYVIDMVKKLRKERRLTNSQIAEIINTKASFIGNVESPTNVAKYNLKHINLLAKYFNVSPQFFLPDEPFKDSDVKKMSESHD